ncbi:uncharacterized protein PAC_16403 [Phialocephala subalpina]|uniref:Uncharacterized protein n=1 Tax=Phialocephala subalpina TaxID=576137 RepID=A0A1L7XN94_9HELO|nr:uncharacterized protein PAC_16403 [Phialocephala subalpina]
MAPKIVLFTVLLRNIPQGLKEKYPNMKIVEGDFDNTALISATAAENDIAIREFSPISSLQTLSMDLTTTAIPNTNLQSKAHIAGRLHTATPSSPRSLIRLGGTGAIADWAHPTYHRETNPKIWSAISDITITALPDTALYRNIEKIVQDAAAEHGDCLKCVIICSCGVYGQGRDLGKKQSSLVSLYYCQGMTALSKAVRQGRHHVYTSLALRLVFDLPIMRRSRRRYK